MAQLFLSYAREDRACAELLANALADRGWSVWWDRQIQVGRSFSETIERELAAAKCVIVLWSRHSLASDWVQNEAAEAARRKALVPVRIEDVQPPLEFRRLQTADIFDWRQGFNSPDFDACLSSIEFLVGITDSHPIPTAPGRRSASSTATPPKETVPPPPVTPPPSRAQTPVPSGLPQIPNYLVPAVLVTVGCCLPSGIVAIIYSAQVNTRLAAGDMAGASRSSALAKQWCWVSVVVGVITFFILAGIGSMNQM